MLASVGLGSVGSYPCIMGRVPYRVSYPTPLDSVSGVNASRFVESNHQYFSYGQNLTINWSYVGGSNVLTLSSTTRMFAGLRLTLDNGGGDENYVVTGVYPTLGYVTVVRWRTGTSATYLAGTYGTTYSGATVKQESYSFSRTGMLPPAKAVSNTTAGATTAIAGDLTGAAFVNLLLTAVGAANFTTRTAAEMFGDIAGAYVGLTYMLSIKNTNAGTTTLNPGTNVTPTGTMTIAQNTARLFHVTFPTATTCTITSLGVTATT